LECFGFEAFSRLKTETEKEDRRAKETLEAKEIKSVNRFQSNIKIIFSILSIFAERRSELKDCRNFNLALLSKL
jgi:hypothetical protein